MPYDFNANQGASVGDYGWQFNTPEAMQSWQAQNVNGVNPLPMESAPNFMMSDLLPRLAAQAGYAGDNPADFISSNGYIYGRGTDKSGGQVGGLFNPSNGEMVGQPLRTYSNTDTMWKALAPVAMFLGAGAITGAFGGAAGATGAAAAEAAPATTVAAGGGATAGGAGAASVMPSMAALEATGGALPASFYANAVPMTAGASPIAGEIASASFAPEFSNAPEAASRVVPESFNPAVDSQAANFAAPNAAPSAQEILSALANPAVASLGGGGLSSLFGGMTVKDLAGGLNSLYGLQQARKLKRQMAPFDQYREEYGRQLQELERNPNTIVNRPGYQAGLQATQRANAAGGYLGSGNELVALQKYGGDFYNNEVARLANLAGAGAPPGAGSALYANLLSRSLAGLGYTFGSRYMSTPIASLFGG